MFLCCTSKWEYYWVQEVSVFKRLLLLLLKRYVWVSFILLFLPCSPMLPVLFLARIPFNSSCEIGFHSHQVHFCLVPRDCITFFTPENIGNEWSRISVKRNSDKQIVTPAVFNQKEHTNFSLNAIKQDHGNKAEHKQCLLSIRNGRQQWKK